MSAFEDDKRRNNLAQSYKETKGLRNGHCNRAACQAPLRHGHQSYMRDHEMMTDGKLYYCLPCTRLFDEADMQFSPDQPKRCTMDTAP